MVGIESPEAQNIRTVHDRIGTVGSELPMQMRYAHLIITTLSQNGYGYIYIYIYIYIYVVYTIL